MRNRLQSRLVCFLVAAFSTAGPASAQPKAKKAATEAFKACREQEKFGDATSCWRAWLEKHRNNAQEAEVLYAEEKVKQASSGSAKQTPETGDEEAPAESAPASEPAAGAEGEQAESSESAQAEVSLEDEATDDDAAASAPSGLGLSVMAHGSAALFVLNDGEQRFLLPNSQFATYNVPSFGYGGGLSVGYSLTKLLGWRDTHVRLGVERLVGTGDGTSVAVTNVELAAEKGFPLSTKLKLYLALGPSLSLAELNVVPPEIAVPNQTGRTQELNTTRFGGTARVGLELSLTARLAARLEAVGRVNTKGFYEPADGNIVYWDFEKRRDSFSSAGARLGLIVAF